MTTAIQVVIDRNLASQEKVLRFFCNDLETVASLTETATEILNSSLTKDDETGALVLLSTDIGYFNLMKEEDHILLMAVDIESRSGMEPLIELLKENPTFLFVEETSKAEPRTPLIENNKNVKDDSDCTFLDGNDDIIPELLWGINPHGG